MGSVTLFSPPRRPHPARLALLVLAALSVVSGWGAVAVACPLPVIDEAELLPGRPAVFRSGDSVTKDGIFAIALQPVAEVYLVRAVHGEPTGYGGMVTFENLPEARFELSFSQDARVQLVEHPDLSFIALIERTRSSCGVVAEFFAKGGPVTLQVTGASAPSISLVVRRLPD